MDLPSRIREDGSANLTTASHGRHRSNSVDRQYTPSKRSFSVPRKSSHADMARRQHSASNSTSSTSSSIPSSGFASSVLSNQDPGRKSVQLQVVPGSDSVPRTDTASLSSVGDTSLPWRPFYLQRRILGTFAALFVGIIVALEALLDISNRNDGLPITSSSGVQYLCIYGAPFILTLEVAAWNRVDVQAKITAPWIRMAKGPASADRTVLLDYTSRFQPYAVIQAFRNRDFIVAVTCTITMLLKFLIIISTALITLTADDMDSLYGVAGNNASATTITQRRLVVLPVTVQLMVALLSLSLVLLGFAILIVPRKGFLPTSPNTIVSQATLLANSETVLRPLRGYGAADDVAMRQGVDGFNYQIGVEVQSDKSEHPVSFKVIGEAREDLGRDYDDPTGVAKCPTALHPAIRVTGYVAIIAIMIVIEITLRMSQRTGGLADYQYPGPERFLWASMPALLLSCLSLHLETMDITARALAPFANMKHGANFDASINLNMIDKSTPFVIIQAIRIMNPAVLLFVLASSVGSFLLMLTGTLFGEMAVETSITSNLQIKDTFVMSPASSNTTTEEGVALARLVLQGNLTYPPFTFEDLAFPSLLLPSDLQLSSIEGSTLVTNSTVPAVRAKLTCKMYNAADIEANLTLGGYNLGGLGIINPLRITILGEYCGLDKANETAGNNLVLGLGNSSSFGPLFGANDAPIRSGCSEMYFAWGSLATNATDSADKVRPIAALACNETNEVVDTATTFLGSEFHIDPAMPPRTNETTARSTTKALDNTADVYNACTNITSAKGILSPAFGTLTTSRYAIPVEHLGDSTKKQEVSDALQFQHGVIRAQITSASLRGPTNSTNSILTGKDTLSRAATITSTDGLRRVVQDVATTRLIQGFLAFILVASIGSWALMPDTKILPRAPGSIANVAALIAESNLLSFLPKGAEWMGPTEIRRLFADVEGFRMGYAPVRRRIGERGRGTERYMIHVLKAGAWRGGEEVGLGLHARVNKGHKAFIRGLKD